MPPFITYILLLLIPILTTAFSLLFINYLDKDSMKVENGKSKVKFVEQANNQFLPSYLGYFFVALSIPNCETLFFSYLIIYVFAFFSQVLYYNPIFLLFGFHFYYITTINDVKIFILTKQIIKDPKTTNFNKLIRINNFTFIDTHNL